MNPHRLTTTEKPCKRCKQPISDERLELGARFCSQRCSQRYHQAKSPSQQRIRQQQPWNRFAAATDPKRRLKVAVIDKAQMQARQLIGAGMCAYENVNGQIRDLGVPKNPEDAGRIFRKKAGSASKQSPPVTATPQKRGVTA